MIADLILFGIIASVSSQSFHYTMSSQDLKKLFLVENIAEVPNYDVVPISIAKPRNRRMSDSLLFQKPFDGMIYMWLNPVNGTLATISTPLWSVGYSGDPYKPIVTSRQDIVNSSLPWIYENTFHATTLVVNNHSNGKHSVQGFIGDKYIKPVPSHLMEYAKRHRRSVNKALDDESNDEIYHVVYDIPKPQKNMLSYSSVSTEKQLASMTTSKSNESNLTILYPEILIIVEHELQQMISESLMQIFLYIITFWNGVDMRFRSLENPKVRLNIAGIIIAEDDKVLPYIYEYKDDVLIEDPDSALYDQGIWLYKMNHTFPIDSYDFAVTMMPYSMCNFDDPNDCGIIGYSPLGEACAGIDELIDDDGQKLSDYVVKASLVKDSSFYDGIITAVHELGYLFGLKHDNVTDNGCKNLGYIMAPSNIFAGHSFEWSKCSLQEMNEFFRSENASCLRNEPFNLNEFEQRYLPGKLMTLDEQCKQFPGSKPEFENDKKEIDCQRVWCLGSDLDILIEPAEGTSCGDGKICLHGQCIEEKSIE